MRFPGRSTLWAAVGCAIVIPVLALGAFATRAPKVVDGSERPAISGPEQPPFVEDFSTHPPGERWRDGARYGQWLAQYDGYGRTEITAGDERRLAMTPRSATDPEATHGGLVTTVSEFADIDVTATLGTVRQVRNGPANPWEVAWLLWHYTDDQHFYSIVLKPNGWELGKEDPAYPGAQRFLATGATPSFPIGVQRIVRVRQIKNSITVWVNGRLLATATDRERPYVGGRIGLYTEDAQVIFDNVSVNRP